MFLLHERNKVIISNLVCLSILSIIFYLLSKNKCHNRRTVTGGCGVYINILLSNVTRNVYTACGCV